MGKLKRLVDGELAGLPAPAGRCWEAPEACAWQCASPSAFQRPLHEVGSRTLRLRSRVAQEGLPA